MQSAGSAPGGESIRIDIDLLNGQILPAQTVDAILGAEAAHLVQRFRALGRALRNHGPLCNCEGCRLFMEIGDGISRISFEVLEAAIREEVTMADSRFEIQEQEAA